MLLQKKLCCFFLILLLLTKIQPSHATTTKAPILSASEIFWCIIGGIVLLIILVVIIWSIIFCFYFRHQKCSPPKPMTPADSTDNEKMMKKKKQQQSKAEIPKKISGTSSTNVSSVNAGESKMPKKKEEKKHSSKFVKFNGRIVKKESLFQKRPEACFPKPKPKPKQSNQIPPNHLESEKLFRTTQKKLKPKNPDFDPKQEIKKNSKTDAEEATHNVVADIKPTTTNPKYGTRDILHDPVLQNQPPNQSKPILSVQPPSLDLKQGSNNTYSIHGESTNDTKTEASKSNSAIQIASEQSKTGRQIE